MNLQQMIAALMANNPNIQNNPVAMNMLSAIQNGDNVKGEQFAKNWCKSQGMSEQDAYQKAQQWLSGMMGGQNNR